MGGGEGSSNASNTSGFALGTGCLKWLTPDRPVKQRPEIVVIVVVVVD